jgi:hypothetical protein
MALPRMMVSMSANLNSSVNAWTPVVWVMALVVILRVGSECVFSPLNNASLRLLPPEWCAWALACWG